MALEQEPPLLNPLLVEGLHNSTFAVVETMLAGAYQLQPDSTYLPDLIEGDPEVQQDPFRLTYRIKADASWDDGTPVGAEDFRFTWATIVDPDLDIGDRAGYELIEDADIVDGKTITFTFTDPFAPFKQLFTFVLPSHELDGQDFDKVWNKEITVSSGPFRFESWVGSDLTVIRNDQYWGDQPARLDELVFQSITDPNSQVQALLGGEVHAIAPRASRSILELEDEADLIVDSELGMNWEHLAFQHGDPLLSELFVRHAIAHAIDRTEIVGHLIEPLHREAGVLDSLVYVTNQASYQPSFDRWTFDPERSRDLLESNGCVLGDDDIYECDGRRLSFSFTAASDDPNRKLVFELIKDYLGDVGIELSADLRDPNVVYSKVLPTDRWDLFMFAWTTSGDPAGASQIWGCQGALNFLAYCDREVDRAFEGADSILDATARAERYNEIDSLMAEGLPALPLYQNPTFLIFDSSLQGPVNNPTNAGPAWNANEWYFTR